MLIQEIQRFNDKEAREGSSDVKTDDKGREEQRADQILVQKRTKKKWQLKMNEKEPLQCWIVNIMSSTNSFY